jgi:hypothetical protein
MENLIKAFYWHLLEHYLKGKVKINFARRFTGFLTSVLLQPELPKPCLPLVAWSNNVHDPGSHHLTLHCVVRANNA